MSIVIQPLDRALAALRLALFPVLLLVAGLPTIRALTSTSPQFSRNVAVGLVAAGVVVVYVAVLQTQVVGSRVDRVLAHVRRRVALACDHDGGSAHVEGGLACHLTSELLRAPLFRYDDQHRAVSALAEACGDDRSSQFWFVEGNTGSGKTRTALLLVQTLVRDLSLFELGSRCFLYDFAESADTQDAILRRIGSSRHDGAVVFIDNFQLVRASVLRALTRRLIDRAGATPERLVVFLARPGDAWNLSPGSDVRLLSEAKAARRHLKLTGARADAVARSVQEYDPAAAELLRRLQDGHVASAAQLHIAQVIARNREVAPEVTELLRLLSDRTADLAEPRLVHALAISTALSMHRGTFARRDLWRALRVAGRALAPRAPTRCAFGLAMAFRRLTRVGLVARINVGGKRYLFHEAIAELCIDRLYALSEFNGPFAAVGRARLKALEAEDQQLGAWLVAAEIETQEVLETSFEGAVSRGAYARMAGCLRRAGDRYALSNPVRLQLAILLDRTGDFAGSRALVTDVLVGDGEGENGLDAVLATLRVEATHDTASQGRLAMLEGSPDRRVAIVGEYWRAHIAGHRGIFHAQALHALANETLKLLGEREGYWLTYSLARMHFDALRHQLLSGGSPIDAVGAPERRAVDEYLRTRLATFEALRVLYTQAHRVGHVLLAELAIFGRLVSADGAAEVEIDMTDAASVDALVCAAQRLYRRARDEFWQYGDREAEYLQADILNADLIGRDADLDAFPVRLHEYERFVLDAGFDDLRSYPHLYFLRWHMLKHYAVLLDPSAATHARTADEHLAEAYRHQRRIVELDTLAENEYGLLRAELLGLLLRGVREPLLAGETSALQSRAEARGYRFEGRLLEHIRERGNITSAELRSIFRFYPFVHQ